FGHLAPRGQQRREVGGSGNRPEGGVVRSSGHETLDNAAIAAARAVGTVPPPPLETARSFSMPFVYRLPSLR
ncbi:MAG: TonB family protein, partial [Myxococcota bacterium]